MISVLVVGAGPTGLTLACELLRRGISCRVVERSPDRLDRVRAVDVQARTLEVLQQVGISDSVLQRGNRLLGMSIYERHRPMARLRHGEGTAPFPFAVALSQSITEELLEERLRELGATVERGVELTELTVAEDGAVAKVVGHDTHEHIGARWVVGCDGARSTVRELANITLDAQGAVHTFAMADAELGWAVPRDEISLFLKDQGFVAVVPMPEGRARLIIDNDSGEPYNDLLTFADACSERVGATVLLGEPGRAASYRVISQQAREFRSGPVLLAGDAAHVFNPVGGHGMNQGIQDAFALAAELEPIVSGAKEREHIATYSDRRRDVARSLASRMDFEARLAIARLDVDEEQGLRLRELLVDCPPLRRAVLDAAIDMFRSAA